MAPHHRGRRGLRPAVGLRRALGRRGQGDEARQVAFALTLRPWRRSASSGRPQRRINVCGRPKRAEPGEGCRVADGAPPPSPPNNPPRRCPQIVGFRRPIEHDSQMMVAVVPAGRHQFLPTISRKYWPGAVGAEHRDLGPRSRVFRGQSQVGAAPLPSAPSARRPGRERRTSGANPAYVGCLSAKSSTAGTLKSVARARASNRSTARPIRSAPRSNGSPLARGEPAISRTARVRGTHRARAFLQINSTVMMSSSSPLRAMQGRRTEPSHHCRRDHSHAATVRSRSDGSTRLSR